MKKLLCFEFEKLLRTKTFYIFVGLNILAILLSLNIYGGVAHLGIYVYNSINIYNIYFTGLISLFIAIYICKEYSNNTLSNIYSKGYSCTLVLISKYIVCMSACGIYLILNIILRLIIGSIYLKVAEIEVQNFASHFAILILFFYSYNTVIFSIVYTIKNTFICIPVATLGIYILDPVYNSFVEYISKKSTKPILYLHSLGIDGLFNVEFTLRDLSFVNILSSFNPSVKNYANWQFFVIPMVLILYIIVSFLLCVYLNKNSEKI